MGVAQVSPEVKLKSKTNTHEGDAGGIAVREGGRDAYGGRGARSAVVRH